MDIQSIVKDYPKREIQLFKILDGRIETIETLPAKYQELTFSKLFGYLWIKGHCSEAGDIHKKSGLEKQQGRIQPACSAFV